jgi:hypothetical protein
VASFVTPREPIVPGDGSTTRAAAGEGAAAPQPRQHRGAPATPQPVPAALLHAERPPRRARTVAGLFAAAQRECGGTLGLRELATLAAAVVRPGSPQRGGAAALGLNGAAAARAVRHLLHLGLLRRDAGRDGTARPEAPLEPTEVGLALLDRLGFEALLTAAGAEE